MKLDLLKFAIIFGFFYFQIPEIRAEEADSSRINYSAFKPFKSLEEPETSRKITYELKKIFQSDKIGFSILGDDSLNENLSISKKEKGGFFITGYYKKKRKR